MITGEEIKESMIGHNINKVAHHKCGICGVPTMYVRTGDLIFYDSSCDCTSFENELQLLDWDNVAGYINGQNNFWYTKILGEFGIGRDLPVVEKFSLADFVNGLAELEMYVGKGGISGIKKLWYEICDSELEK